MSPTEAKAIPGFTGELDKDSLDRFLTSDGLNAEEREAGERARATTPAFVSRFLSDDPNAMLSNLYALSGSTAAAHGIAYARNMSYYDALDEAVSKDTDLQSAMDLIVSMMLQRGYELVPADDSPEAALLRDMVHVRVIEMEHEAFDLGHVLHTLPLGKLQHGFSVCETIWRPSKGEWNAHCWINRHPGLFTFDATGRLGLISSKSKDGWIYAPDAKFVALRTGGMYGNPMGRSVVDGCQYLYQIKKAALIAWLRFAEKYGKPYMVGKLTGANDTTGQDRTMEWLNEMEAIIEAAGNSDGCVLRTNQTMEFIRRAEGAGSGETVQERLFKWASRETFRFVLGSVLHVLEAEFGSRAQAETHADTGAIKIRPLAKAVAKAVNRDIVRPWVLLNRGERFLKIAPRFVIDTDDEMDVESAIKILEAAATARIPTSLDQAREWLGLREPKSLEDTILLVSTEEASLLNDDQAKIEAAKKLAKAPVAKEAASFAESETDRRRSAKRVDAVLQAASEASAADLHGPIAEAMQEWAAEIRRASTISGKLDGDVAFVFPSEAGDEAYRRVATVALMMAGADLAAALSGSGSDPEFAAGDPEPPSMFADAVRWMLDRKIMDKAQIADLVKELVDSGFPQDEAAAERIIRDHVLAISGTANPQVAARIQSMVAAAVRGGTDVGDFLAGLDDLNADGLLPGGTDAYLEMVFRTESGRMYQEQQDALLRAPELAPFLWGYQLFNPRDDRSRDSHAAIDGLLIRRDSAADIASRPGPPWSYACRCIRSAVIVPDASDSDVEESPGALAKVLAIERF